MNDPDTFVFEISDFEVNDTESSKESSQGTVIGLGLVLTLLWFLL